MQSLCGARVLVLGATGFLGRRLVARWHEEEGAEITTLVRRWSRATPLARFPVRMLEGDVLDLQTLCEAAREQDVIVDFTFPAVGDLKERVALAEQGARNVVAAAQAGGARRVIHTSTVSVLGTPAEGTLSDARSTQASSDPYAESKRAGEVMALAQAAAAGVSLTVVRPTVVYGPESPWSAGSLAWIRNARPALPDGGVGMCNAVYVDDVIDGICDAACAEDSAVGGKPFLLSGPEPITWATFYEAHARLLRMDPKEACASLPLDRIRQQWRAKERSKRAIQSLVRRLRTDGGLRSDVMRLPVLRHTFGATQRVLPERGWDGFKNRLLGKRAAPSGAGATSEANGTAAAPTRPVDLPAPTLLELYASRAVVDISAAREAMGYAPRFDFAAGMARTGAWAAWARLCPAGPGPVS